MNLGKLYGRKEQEVPKQEEQQSQEQGTQVEPAPQQQAAAAEEPAQSVDGGKPQESETEAPKYSDKDVDRIIQRTIAKERERAEKLAKAKEEEATEAEKLKSMTELERARYEAKKLEEENRTLREAKSLDDQKSVARKELADAGIKLSDELLEMFVAPEAEKTNAAIAKLKELWPQEVNKSVQEALKRKPPEADGTCKGTPSFGASYAKSYSESKLNGGI